MSAAVVDLDARRWRTLVNEALACAQDDARPRGTLYALADEAQATKRWPHRPGNKSDEYLLATLVRIARAFTFASAPRRGNLRQALRSIAAEVLQILEPTEPEGAAAVAPVTEAEPEELPAWTRRADAGIG